ncbi:MAG: hypothetical protein Q9191_007428, partial [Dirinaria sp. TL-2023a]
CHTLESQFPNITYVDTGDQSVQYKAILQSYFNVPNELPPNCFIQPQTALQISKIVSTLSQAKCQFAVRGGGHMLFVGSNGIQNGVTIDLRQMKQTTLSTDKKTASVEPGSKLGEVYTTLDALGYAIPGGRASDVGVAGLTLGGGNSFYAARYGFVCDNVKNFEIVLGNGTLTNANANENPDLYKALKGGSGNLGLVTRFDFVAFRGGPLWGGVAVYNYTDFHKSIEPFIEFTKNIATDPYGSLISLWTHNGTSNETLASNLYEYTGNATEKPYYTSSDPENAPNPFPKSFANFTFDKIGKPVANTLRVDSLYNFTFELNSADGLRNVYSPIIFNATTPVLTQVDSIIYNTIKSTFQDPPYLAAQTQYQPIPRIFTNHSLERGGNVLGLDRLKDNSIILNFLMIWSDPAKDEIIRKVLDTILTNVTNYTQKVGAYRPWQYTNYAYEDQDPIGSYGPDNVQYLKDISQKYDPGQVFQKLVPGGWKLTDAGKRKKQFNFNHFEAFKAS